MVKMTCPPKNGVDSKHKHYWNYRTAFDVLQWFSLWDITFFPPSSHLRFLGNDEKGVPFPGLRDDHDLICRNGLNGLNVEILRLRFLSFWDCLCLSCVNFHRFQEDDFQADGFLLVQLFQLPMLVKKCLVNHRKSLEFAGWYRVIPQDLGHMVTLASMPKSSCRTCEFPSSSCTILPCTRLDIFPSNVVCWKCLYEINSCILDSW